MNRFAEELRTLERRLILPSAVRRRVLVEVAADLEDLYRHHREAGVDEIEASRRAIATCDLSEDAVRELVSVHSGGVNRLQDQAADLTRSRWDHGLLVVLVFLSVFLAMRSATILELARDGGPCAWLILVLAVAALVWAAMLMIKPEPAGGQPRIRGHRVLLILAGCQLATAVLGSWVELYRAALAAQREVTATGLFLVDWIQSTVALSLLALTAALISSLFWFALAGRAAAREERAVADLLARAEPTP